MTKPKVKPAAGKAVKSAASVKSASPAKRAVAATHKVAPTKKARPGVAAEVPKKVSAKPAPAKAAAVKPAPAKTAPAKRAAAPVKAAVKKPEPAAKPVAAAPKAAPATAPRPAIVASKPTAAPVRPGAPVPAKAPEAVAKKPTIRTEFKAGEYIVYPAHGVGRIVGIDTQEVAGLKLDLFVISFLKDKMTLRVPTTKATGVGMRKLADPNTVKRALETVRGRARIKRTMWSRRAQEYEAKINSGDLISIAEVVRDLYRSENQPEQSYSERQLYEAALDRMSREISSVSRISETEAIRQIEQNLAKSPRRGAKPEGEEAAAQEKAA
jgi:CarD family transcriptional regulator